MSFSDEKVKGFRTEKGLSCIVYNFRFRFLSSTSWKCVLINLIITSNEDVPYQAIHNVVNAVNYPIEESIQVIKIP